jgi:hypothetical protein
MDIRINLAAVGMNLGSLIEAKLEERKLPACLGNMIPPMLSKIVDIDDKEVIALTESLKDEEKVEADMMRFIISDNIDKTKVSLTKEGLEKIEQSKIELVNRYVNRLNNCVTCSLADTCNKLTQNYLNLIAIEKPKGEIE